MPKFVTIGYGAQEGYDRTAPAIRDAAHAHDAKLQREGVLMGIAGAPVQVRNPDASRVETTVGPFMMSTLPVAGFAIIEAADLAEAIEMVSRTPCAVAQGVVEVWPLEQPS
ncbi:MAG: YciI family protein [Parvibaculum sp.]